MVSVERWKEHFKQLAHREFPNEDMYIVNQRGRGIGRNAYKKTVYKVRNPKPGQVNIVSPVAQTVQRARAQMNRKKRTTKATPRKGIKKRAPSTSRSRAVSRRGGKTKGKQKKKRAAPKKSHKCPCPATVRIKPKRVIQKKKKVTPRKKKK